MKSLHGFVDTISQLSSHSLDAPTWTTGHPRIPHCQLPVWHEPCAPGATPDGFQGGYISPKGHYFPCVHSSSGEFGCYSTYLIIDRSGVPHDDEYDSHEIRLTCIPRHGWKIGGSPLWCVLLTIRLNVGLSAGSMGSHDVHPSSPDVVRSPGYCSSLECRLGVVYEV